MFGSQRRREAAALEWWMATFSALGFWLIHVAITVAGVLIFWKTLPRFNNLFQQFHLELPSQFQSIMKLSAMAKEYWWVILAAAAVDFIILYIFTQFWLLRWLKRLWFWIVTLALVAVLVWIVTGIFMTSAFAIDHLIDQQATPVEEPAEPSEPAAEPDDTVTPAEEPTDATTEPDETTEVPTDTTDEATDTTDTPADSTDEAADTADTSGEATEAPAETTTE